MFPEAALICRIRGIRVLSNQTHIPFPETPCLR